MITIISATNRPNSNTHKIATYYLQLIKNRGVEASLLSLEQLPADIAFNEVFNNRSTAFQQILDQYIIPAQKYVIIAPEYNGSFPGILKTFIDAMHPELIRGKKVALVGVSSGRAGNLRGMEHLTGILHYLGLHVHPNKLPVSSVLGLLDEQGNVKDAGAIAALEKHVGDVVSF
ncbi:MAG: NAD(P)H-dependent oxidoreductase [Bacteroidota bacterium]